MTSEDQGRLADAIYDAGFEPERWPGVLEAISARFGGAAVTLCQEAPRRFGLGNVWTRDANAWVWTTARCASGYWTVYVNPAIAALVSAPVGRALDRRQIVDDETFAHDPLARPVGLGLDCFHMMLASVHRTAGVESAFWIGRDRDRPPIRDGERTLFEALLPPLGRALRLHHALETERLRAAMLGDALDRLRTGALLVDRDLRLGHANAAAADVLGAGDALGLVAGRLSCRSAETREDLAAAVRRVALCRTEAHVVAPRGSDGAPLVLHLLPLRSGHSRRPAPHGEIAIFVVDPEATPPEPAAALLGRVHDLTDTEARVATLAGRALRTAAIAEALGVSENTVKTHLKAVFRKLGVRNQPELVRRVLGLSMRI